MARQTPDRSEAPEPETIAPEVATQPEEPNGIFIMRSIDAEGNLGVDVRTVGDCKITEAPTVLALGRKLIVERLGLNG